MRLHIGVLCAASVSALALLSPTDAPACSGLVCDPERVTAAPADGATLPANAPGLVAQTRWQGELHSFELDGGDAGTPVTTLETIGQPKPYQGVLKLGAPLVPGATYQFSFGARCANGYDGGSLEHEHTVAFTAGPPSPLPSTIGSADVNYTQAKLGGRYGHHFTGGVAGITQDSLVAVANITIQPSAQLTPYLPLTRFSTYVDGKPWGESEYGHGTGTYEEHLDTATYRDFVRVFAVCREAGSSSCNPTGIAVGKHDVEIRAQVAGAATEPTPLQFQIDLACLNDGGSPHSSSADGAPNETEDGGTRRSEVAPRRGDADGGCTLAHGKPPREAVGAALALLFVSALRLRRRARTRPG